MTPARRRVLSRLATSPRPSASTALCLHAPAAGVPPAPRASLGPGLLRPAPLPTAVRARGAVVRVTRFPPPRHRALDHGGRARRLPPRALLAVRFGCLGGHCGRRP